MIRSSLVPRPHTPTKEWPGIYCSRMREIIGRIYGIGSVSVSVNRLRHVAKSSIETVYKHSKRKNYKPDFLQLKWLSNQSGILEEPAIFIRYDYNNYLTIKFRKRLSPGSNRELLDFQSQM